MKKVVNRLKFTDEQFHHQEKLTNIKVNSKIFSKT